MLRRDWSLKPNGEAYQDLVFKRWWTNADGKTAASGTAEDGTIVDEVLVPPVPANPYRPAEEPGTTGNPSLVPHHRGSDFQQLLPIREMVQPRARMIRDANFLGHLRHLARLVRASEAPPFARHVEPVVESPHAHKAAERQIR